MKQVTMILLLSIILFTACKKPGCTDPLATNFNAHATQNDNSCQYDTIENHIQGAITEDLTLTNDKIWTLTGRVSVTNGTTLTIEPGTIIKATAGTGANATALLIARGGKINAVGTASNPIIFTSTGDDIQYGQTHGSVLAENVSGLWGGILICGYAPISAPGNIQSMQIEGIPASDGNGLYGGTDDNDNSGILQYVSIRHGGANIGEGNEINGLTLAGVGSETIISDIEVVANQDDGVEFFGGTVNAINVLVWNVGDDCIDVDQGWGGELNNALIVPRPGFGAGTENIVEADGGEGNWNAPFVIENITVISNETEDMHFRADAVGYISLFGDVAIEANVGTAVVVSTLSSGIDQNIFNWTYWYNH
jgi:hypothetical protein